MNDEGLIQKASTFHRKVASGDFSGAAQSFDVFRDIIAARSLERGGQRVVTLSTRFESGVLDIAMVYRHAFRCCGLALKESTEMYVPKHFRMDDLETVKAFISNNEFATVVSVSNGSPIASHLLTESREDEHGNVALYAHMARNNPQWKSFDPKTEVLAIFHGSHTYISPTWYRENPAVPTWNYLAVHAYGYPRIIDDRSELYSLLERLVERHEKGNNSQSEYHLSDLVPDFIESMMRGVVGVRIAISRIEASFKLSQNRSSEDYQRIIIELAKRPDEDSRSVAKAMEKYRPEGKAPGTQASKP